MNNLVKMDDKYPAYLGGEYKSINMEDEVIAILEEVCLRKDFFRLKCPDSPWIFEGNYATFTIYWEHIK